MTQHQDYLLGDDQYVLSFLKQREEKERFEVNEAISLLFSKHLRRSEESISKREGFLKMKKNQHPAYFRAYNLIKSKIIRNEFNPRQSLNEVDLAKEFSLSRTPVREALIMLEKDGLITRFDLSRGFYIKQYSLQDIDNLYEFRQIIELPLVCGIINNATDYDLQKLSGILSEVDEIIDQNQPAYALVRAIDFHLCCFQVCTKNAYIIEALRNCYEKLIIISWSCQDIETCTRSAGEHKQMLEALKARNLSALMECTQRHISGARDRMIETLKVGADRLYYLP